jgi:hypothetical protein
MRGHPGQTCAPDLFSSSFSITFFSFFKKKSLLNFCYHIFSYCFFKKIIKSNEVHDSDRGLDKLSHETRVNPIYFSLFYI